MAEPLKLEAVELRKSFKSREVVKSVSFEIREQEVVGLLGPNGAGKTTSFYMVVGLLYPNSGKVLMGGRDITKLPMHIRARRGISYLPQNMSIFRKMSVEDNFKSVMEVVGVPAHERKNLLEELLTKFQIGHISKSMGAALSGGERRRVEIARSLIIKPKFLLLDEPFAGIDPVTVQEIQGIIQKLRDEEGLGVLITDHNVRETLGACDRSYILTSGNIVAHGLPDEIANNQVVREVYLGENFRL
ncbi:LPS export ABC transporter ATP-binding protein [Pseudobacteriovorax antillogorgiicola]|uniref:Lipopolysaccharide export system ATP-binding protein LptB n=1 Tax=Pseudobacteriovorax antillogorgiicola TaxID=1513793 RepID=A0A1Y6B8R7_9BACT|nr:LPS export ABC transporter ATP-binding protein [Pseudobacteriovorax antillogorgiicola]TCS59131.1 lipopolysaccharide export system ATP-binding protein [Pseudobacteriovorax antillogorgiicola]SME91393.1 lipopolysaccharide export system ATP-binding protein [Pseudobacteriovorax antillogorgiicola]